MISATNSDEGILSEPNTGCTNKEATKECHDLNGMRVLLEGVHLEGNLGGELKTTPLLADLKQCGVVTVALLNNWISHPQHFDP
eukprot:2655199-Ditylum_brightwellii.AAC.1